MHITILGVLFFLLLITVLVAAHELGHFLFARWFKMEVEEFAIGLGKPKWTWMKRGETEYTLRAWPLGGFVRVKGMLPHEDGSEVLVENGFYSRPPWQRLLVLFAGPLFSVVAGVGLITGLFATMGVQIPETDPVIGSIVTNKSGYKAGLRAGDRILAVQGQPVRVFFDFVKAIRDRPGLPTTIDIERKGVRDTLTVKPDVVMGPVLNREFEPTSEERVQGKLGLGPKFTFVHVGFAGSFVRAVELPWKIVARLAGNVLQPSRLKDDVGGPIAIFGAAQESANNGMPGMVSLAGALSISLGIINLLPAVPLDGGQMMVAMVERFRRGRRLSFKVQTVLLNLGLTFVGLLVLSAILLDVSRLRP